MARVIVDTWFAAHKDQVSESALKKRREEWGYAESEQGWRRAIREAENSSSLILAACEESRIVGVAASEVTGNGCAEVGALYVDVACQRSGTGRDLLRAIIEHYQAVGISILQIATLTANPAARNFYEKMGGQISGFRNHEEGAQVVYQWDLMQVENSDR